MHHLFLIAPSHYIALSHCTFSYSVVPSRCTLSLSLSLTRLHLLQLIVWGETRSDALRHMSSALAEYALVGLPNNLGFLRGVVAHPLFAEGGVDTSFLNHHLEACLPSTAPAHPHAVALAAIVSAATASASPFSALLLGSDGQGRDALTAAVAMGDTDPWSPWGAADGSRPGAPAADDACSLSLPFVDPHAAAVAVDAAAATAASADASGAPVPPPSSSVRAVVKRVPSRGGVRAHSSDFLIGIGTSSRSSSSGSSGDLSALPECEFTVVTRGVSVRSIDREVAQRSVIPGFAAATVGRTLDGVSAHSVTATLDGVTHKANVVIVVDSKTGASEVTVFPQGAMPPLSSSPSGSSLASLIPAPVQASSSAFLHSTTATSSSTTAPAAAHGKSDVIVAPELIRAGPTTLRLPAVVFGAGLTGGAAAAAAAASAVLSVSSPMPGKVVKVLAGVGQIVSEMGGCMK